MTNDRQPRIVSLIASATEIVCALDRGDCLVGRSHECDFPPRVAALPAITQPKFKVEGSSAAIDRRVRELVRNGLSVYRVDAEALSALAPDVILTQDHCEVCAVSLTDVEKATATWIGRVARALGAEAAGHTLVAAIDHRLRRLAARATGRKRPRVAFIEWVEPLM